MKLLIGGLIALFVVLQARLWFGDGGLHEVSRAKKEVARLSVEVTRQRDINIALRAEVTDLGNGLGEIEERARAELGMIGSDETFYQFVGKKNDAVAADTLAQRRADTSAIVRGEAVPVSVSGSLADEPAGIVEPPEKP